METIEEERKGEERGVKAMVTGMEGMDGWGDG